MIVRDQHGTPTNHITWFKVLLNPLLRKLFKCHIVSQAQEGKVLKYVLRKYGS